MHIICVRGSPIFRTLLILVVVAAAGFLFVQLTENPKNLVPRNATVDSADEVNEVLVAKVFLTLSGKARSVEFSTNGSKVQLGQSNSETRVTDLKIAKDNPLLEIQVDWLEEVESRRFAKVVVEAPGHATFTHVFDASGNIDDFVELPF